MNEKKGNNALENLKIFLCLVVSALMLTACGDKDITDPENKNENQTIDQKQTTGNNQIASLAFKVNNLEMVNHQLLYSLNIGDEAGFSPNGIVPISFIAMEYLSEENRYDLIADQVVLFKIYMNQKLIETIQPLKIEKDFGGEKPMDFFEAEFSLKSYGYYQIAVSIHGKSYLGEPIKEEVLSDFLLKPKLPKLSIQPQVSVVDTNKNGLIDDLILTFPFTGDIPEEGEIRIYADLQSPNGESLQSTRSITREDNEIFIIFSGEKIFNHQGDAPLLLTKLLIHHNHNVIVDFEGEREIFVNTNTLWEREKLIYARNFSHKPVDINSDGIYDLLEIYFDIDSLISGDYILTGGGNSTSVPNDRAVSFAKYLNVRIGINTIKLLIDGDSLNKIKNNSLDISGILIYHDHKNRDASLYIKDLSVIDQYDFSKFSKHKIEEESYEVKYNHTGKND